MRDSLKIFLVSDITEALEAIFQTRSGNNLVRVVGALSCCAMMLSSSVVALHMPIPSPTLSLSRHQSISLLTKTTQKTSLGADILNSLAPRQSGVTARSSDDTATAMDSCHPRFVSLL